MMLLNEDIAKAAIQLLDYLSKAQSTIEMNSKMFIVTRNYLISILLLNCKPSM